MFVYGENLPMDKVAMSYCCQIEDYLGRSKDVLVALPFWTELATFLKKTFCAVPSLRSEEENHLVQRTLVLLCNLCRVPRSEGDKSRPDSDETTQDNLLMALRTSGMLDVLLYLVGNTLECNFFMHFIELYYFLYLKVDPALLSKGPAQSSDVNSIQDKTQLAVARRVKQSRASTSRNTSARHSNFRGTYLLKGLKSIGENDQIIHNPVTNVDQVHFDREKQKRKFPRNKRPLESDPSPRILPIRIHQVLKEFCSSILSEGGYQLLMKHVKSKIDNTTEDDDKMYYLWNIKFFSCFNRNWKGSIKNVSETISVGTFHMINSEIEKYFDSLKTDKKNTEKWSTRIHLAVQVYNELLSTLVYMDNDVDQQVRLSSRILKSNVFYNADQRELMIMLATSFDEKKFTMSYLTDLILTIHQFLKLLEQFSKNNLSVAEQPKRNKMKQKKKLKTPKAAVPVDMKQLWEDSMSAKISAVLYNKKILIPDLAPFDPLSQKNFDEQQLDAVAKIQKLMIYNDPKQAIAMLRSAREVWPHSSHFGGRVSSKADELATLEEIFLKKLAPQSSKMVPFVPQKESNESMGEDADDEGDLDNEGNVDGEGQQPDGENLLPLANTEARFSFNEFVSRFAQPQIIRALGYLLKNFLNNSDQVNHCVVKLLHRIAFDLDLPSMLFQTSLMKTLCEIEILENLVNKELHEFSKHILARMKKTSDKNPFLYVECVFWKGQRDANGVEGGRYNFNGLQPAWADEEENEIRILYEEYQQMDGGSENLGVSAFILSNLIRQDRSKLAVNKKLREMGYSVTGKKSRKSLRPRDKWGLDEEEQLDGLWSELRESDTPLEAIAARLTVHRPVPEVAKKVLDTGLAAMNPIRDMVSSKEKSIDNTIRMLAESATLSNEQSVSLVPRISINPLEVRQAGRQVVHEVNLPSSVEASDH